VLPLVTAMSEACGSRADDGTASRLEAWLTFTLFQVQQFLRCPAASLAFPHWSARCWMGGRRGGGRGGEGACAHFGGELDCKLSNLQLGRRTGASLRLEVAAALPFPPQDLPPFKALSNLSPDLLDPDDPMPTPIWNSLIAAA